MTHLTLLHIKTFRHNRCLCLCVRVRACAHMRACVCMCACVCVFPIGSAGLSLLFCLSHPTEQPLLPSLTHRVIQGLSALSLQPDRSINRPLPSPFPLPHLHSPSLSLKLMPNNLICRSSHSIQFCVSSRRFPDLIGPRSSFLEIDRAPRSDT